MRLQVRNLDIKIEIKSNFYKYYVPILFYIIYVDHYMYFHTLIFISVFIVKMIYLINLNI